MQLKDSPELKYAFILLGWEACLAQNTFSMWDKPGNIFIRDLHANKSPFY